MKQFEKYTHTRFNLLLHKLKEYEDDPEQETLHQIRVELKKIKTLFYLIQFCSKGFNASREYYSLKDIFRKAGKIRDRLVVDKLFFQYRIKMVQQGTTIAKEYDLISDFRKNISLYLKVVTKSHKVIGKQFNKVDSKCLRKYLSDKKYEAEVSIYPDLDESKLHEARKIIKEVIYLSNISPSSKKKLNQLYDEIQNVIGKWHDKQMLIGLLEEQYSDSEHQNIEKLKSKCGTDIRKLKSMISNLYKKEVAPLTQT